MLRIIDPSLHCIMLLAIKYVLYMYFNSIHLKLRILAALQ